MSILTLPLHPRLVHFPIALLLLGALAVIVYLWKPWPWLKGWGLISLLAGCVLTLPAIVTGLIEKSPIAAATPADQVANIHTTGMFIMWALYGLAAYLLVIWRDEMDDRGKRWRVTLLLLLASLVLIGATHFGGVLVYELGIGVQPS